MRTLESKAIKTPDSNTTVTCVQHSLTTLSILAVPCLLRKHLQKHMTNIYCSFVCKHFFQPLEKFSQQINLTQTGVRIEGMYVPRFKISKAIVTVLLKHETSWQDVAKAGMFSGVRRSEILGCYMCRSFPMNTCLETGCNNGGPGKDFKGGGINVHFHTPP